MEPFPQTELSLPLQNGPVRLDHISPEQLAYLRLDQEREDMDRFTCRPVVPHPAQALEASYKAALNARTMLILGIYTGDNAVPAGKLTAADYNPRNRSAEIGYYLRPSYRRNGYMVKSLYTFCSVLFQLYGLNKVHAQTGAFNGPSIRLLERLGFQRDGVLRRHHAWNGQLWDDYLYSLLAEEFRKIQIQQEG